MARSHVHGKTGEMSVTHLMLFATALECSIATPGMVNAVAADTGCSTCPLRRLHSLCSLCVCLDSGIQEGGRSIGPVRGMAGDGNSSHENVVAKQMLAGAIAGALADGTMYPMMTVKSRLQVQGGSGGGTAALYMYRGPVQAIQTIAAKEGWRTFYKGYATVSQVAPAQALYFGTYQAIKRYLPGGHDSPFVQFGGGILASLVQSTVTVPVEVIRQRQMVQTAGEGSYTGSLHTAKSIYQQEGIRAFYRGFLLNQMVWVPFNAIYLPLWEASKRAWAQFSRAGSVEKLDIRYELGSAFFCSAFAAGLTNPMDVIKTRLQVQGKSNVHSTTQYSGAWDVARTIHKHEGMRGFARGMTSRMLWVAPSAMIMFTTYDQIMKCLVS